MIFRNRRIGVGEGEFAMLKFRSMYEDAPSQQDELEEHNEADGAIFKMRDDPRDHARRAHPAPLLDRRAAAARGTSCAAR